ncbi:amidohydrolase family protein [Umezawaea sp. Da 62-37]|uniref:amidohydrolase family protein n=1 Tax=Umezawaea sp. Da 62-37 TaxID=3075927 RepID=UPI0028F6C194|nr:amidohydrolase family protein [Umezawaea sp. Da 62-37]WNV85594.1 amidohydrolase family protein [Umezawaea sp. Da 62-37]
MADVVFRRGRVVDPGSGHDAVADVHIRDGRVEAVGDAIGPVEGATEIDVAGLVVGPGFVDLHSHVHSVAGHRLQALDGVTTALDLEAGLMPLRRGYADAAAEGRPLNYGFSASWTGARARVLAGIEPDASRGGMLSVLGVPAWQATSTPEQLGRWLGVLEEELADGGLGIGVLMGYAPYSDPAEFLAVARLAARAGVPTFTHVREIVEADPSIPVDGSEEIAVVAAETGAAMHHCHVNSTSRRHVDRVLATLDRARAGGSRVTVEAYPYGAGSTGIGAYFPEPERLARWGMTPANITILRTGERVADEARLRELRATDPGAACVLEYLDEEKVVDRELLLHSLAFPDSIVASDAMPVVWPDGTSESRAWPLPAGGSTHPRTAGTFAKSLRLMVRETATWTWSEAFRRCSYLPARVLDDVAPAMRSKGRLAPGSDADVVVLEPGSITDNATYFDSTRPSTGVRHLVVGGTPVVRDGVLDTTAFPGRAVRGEPR